MRKTSGVTELTCCWRRSSHPPPAPIQHMQPHIPRNAPCTRSGHTHPPQQPHPPTHTRTPTHAHTVTHTRARARAHTAATHLVRVAALLVVQQLNDVPGHEAAVGVGGDARLLAARDGEDTRAVLAALQQEMEVEGQGWLIVSQAGEGRQAGWREERNGAIDGQSRAGWGDWKHPQGQAPQKDRSLCLLSQH